MNLYKYISESINNKLGFTANLEVPRNRAFGDFATNAAMVGAKSAGKNGGNYKCRTVSYWIWRINGI